MHFVSLRQGVSVNTVAIIGAWFVLFLLTIVVYVPGLHGPFVLDDLGVIAGLGERGGVTDWETFKTFVFLGHSGPTGRPVSLITFLIDANNWPAESFPFKRTNLVIHLINGALLGVLINKVLQLIKFDKQDAAWVALISAACWLLHPFLVSTTLYVVQRMAQLATLFVFAGLITHLYGRSFVATNAMKAYVIMSLSLVLFTSLALMSKENGILLPLLIGVVEATVVASQQPRPAVLNRYWAIVFIIVPSTVIALYLGQQFFKDDFFEIVPPRDFSLYERLLTQPRILVDYLQHWFIPKLYTTGVFQDHFIKSTGILSPVTTALSILLHVGLITTALAKRRKWPLFALAILFFYASHILESTVINLEMYFEHRNYLSACFLFVPIVALMREKLTRQLFFVAAIGMTTVFAGFTRYSATIWDNFPSMVEASARKAPTSARAQAQYATNLFNAQRYEESLQVIDRAIEILPNDNPHLLVNRLIILCNLRILDSKEYERVAGVLSGTSYDPRLLQVYTSFASAVAEGRCPDVSIGALRPMFVNMLHVLQNADQQSLAYSHLKYLLGFVDVYAGEPSRAVELFQESLQAQPGAGTAMAMAALLASNDHLEEALHLSELALSQLDADRKSTLRGARVSEADIRAFQAVVRADIDRRPDVDTSDPAQ